MAEEVTMSEYDGYGEDSNGDEDKILEWEIGLPNGNDLTPLSQSLVPSFLALAFTIPPEHNRTVQDVNRASWNTIASLRSFESVDRVGSSSPESDLKKQKKSNGCGEAEEEDSEIDKTASKRPRLVWTSELHKRFVEVVAHLGITNAVPKTIMQLMNVEGLSRENVASHLQKYRLYLKRVHGTDDPSSSDQIGDGKLEIPIPLPRMMPAAVYGQRMGVEGYNNNNNGHNQNYYHKYHHGDGVFESNAYSMMQQSKFESFGNGGMDMDYRLIHNDKCVL